MGDFIISGKTVTSLQINNKEVKRISNGITILWERMRVDTFHIKNTSNTSGTFSVYSSDSNYPNYTNLEYSLDEGLTWTQLNTVNDTVEVQSGATIYIRGNGNGSDFDNEERTTLTFSTEHEIGGNLATLIDYDTADSLVVPDYAYYSLFKGDSTLTYANLTDTDFDKGGTDTYTDLFYNCTNLNEVVVKSGDWDSGNTVNWLHGVSGNGYVYVLGDTTGIPANTDNGIPNGWSAVCVNDDMLCFTSQDGNATIALKIPSGMDARFYYSTDNQATFKFWNGAPINLNEDDKVYIYGENYRLRSEGMLYSHVKFIMNGGNVVASGNVTKLLSIKGVDVLPTEAFAYLFLNCKSLVTAPDMPSKTLGPQCYYCMYKGCDNLDSGPYELPATATTTQCYAGMYDHCKSLFSPPIIQATELNGSYCLEEMFNECTSLGYVTIKASSWDTSKTNNWMLNVPQTGTFKKPAGTTIPTGANGIPSGWTVVNL